MNVFWDKGGFTYMYEKWKTAFLTISTLFLTFSLVLHPQAALQASIRGLNIWWEVVFPSLLPFFIIAELLISIGVVKFIGETVDSYNPEHPFDYFFLDDSFNDMYKSEQKFGKIFNCFSALAILIACLGLLGLISFSAEIRTKEIGIRKVLGASIASVLKLITKEYLLLIAVASVIAWPVSYYFLNNWLKNFSYRINVNWDVFLFSGIIILVIALVTVSYQSVKAARANPVEALKYE